MATSKQAYIHALTDSEGNEVYPVTVGEAVYYRKTDESGVTTQQNLVEKLDEMWKSFQDGVDTLVAMCTDMGVTPVDSTPDGIIAAIEKLYDMYYQEGVDSVEIETSIDGPTVTATLSNGKTASAACALGTNSGSLTATIVADDATYKGSKTFAEGYYYGGTVTADASTVYDNAITYGRDNAYNKYGKTISLNGFEKGSTATAPSAGATYTSTIYAVASGTVEFKNKQLTVTLSTSDSGLFNGVTYGSAWAPEMVFVDEPKASNTKTVNATYT